MSDSTTNGTSLLTPRKIALQLLGFVVGIGLLIWCVRGAMQQPEGWRRLAEASWLLIVGMLGCTLLSTFINACLFWVTVRPLARIPLWNLQFLNLGCNMLNYAPIRLGVIARVAYHIRVDGLSLLQVAGWFAFIGYFLLLAVGACLLATFLHSTVDWIWTLLVLGQVVIGALLVYVFVGNRLLERYGRGIDRIVASHVAIWGGLLLRGADLAMYVLRMAIAMRILDISLSWSSTIVLAVVALAASLVPFGRLGFRDLCVATAATWLSLTTDEVAGNMEQLALVESAGEAAVFLTLGIPALLWYRHQWRRTSRNTDARSPGGFDDNSPSAPDGDSNET